MDEINGTEVRRPRRSRPAIAALLAEYRASGQTQRAFAKRAGVSLASLARWLHGKGGAAAKPGFATVQLRPEAAAAGTIKIRWAEGTELELPLSLGEAVLRRWVSELVAPCSR